MQKQEHITQAHGRARVHLGRATARRDHHHIGMGAGQVHGGIGAAAIHHHHSSAAQAQGRQALQSGLQGGRFVQHRQHNAQRRSHGFSQGWWHS